MNKDNRPEFLRRLYRLRWHIWTVACLAHTIGLFHRASMASMADRLMADFGVTATVFGSLGAAYFYIYAAMQLPAGTLADTLGPRKTITIGLILSATGSLVMSQAPSFPVLYLGRILVSFGVAGVWINALRLIMEWFRHRELGTITGLASAVINSGQIVAATPLAILITTVGWRMSLMTIALVTFGLAVAVWFIVKDHLSQVGLPSLAELEGRDTRYDAELTNTAGMSLLQRFKAVLGNKKLWPLFMFHLGIYGAYVTFFHNWAVVYFMQNYGLVREAAANYVLVSAVGMVISAPLVGLFSDRIQQRRLPAVVLAAISLASFLLLALWQGGRPPLEALYPICFAIGLGLSAVPLLFTSVSAYVRPQLRGTATGLVNMGGFIGAAVAQPLFGYFLDRGWEGDILAGIRIYPLASFQQGILLCCGLAVVGFLGALLTKESHQDKAVLHPERAQVA